VTEIPSVPEAEADYHDLAVQIALLPSIEVTYGMLGAYHRARQAWIDAEWRINCASHRWLTLPSWPDEGAYWEMRVLVERMHWQARRAGLAPNAELAVRPKGVVE